MKLDAHIHFWQYQKDRYEWITGDMKPLKNDFLPEHIQTSFRRNGIDGCIAVEASPTEVETHFLIELARSHPEIIKGVVGWIDLEKNDIEDRLHYFSQYPMIKGWRYGLEKLNPGFEKSPSLLSGFKALGTCKLPFDLLVRSGQLPGVIELTAQFPEQVFVLDHAGKPDIQKKEINDWKIHIRELAKNPKVYCKLSGFLTLAHWKSWSASEFYPYLDILFENFGTNRLIYGSDWPILQLSGIYIQWLSLLEKYMENMEQEEKEKVFGGNGVGVYGVG